MQRRQLNDLRATFSRAQAAYEDYQATRPHIRLSELVSPPVPPPPMPIQASAPAQASADLPARAREPHPVGTLGAVPMQPAVVATVPAPPPARRSRHWVYVLLVLVTASLASLGVSHYKLKGGASAFEVAGLDGTAFEGTIQPTTTFTIAAPAAAIVKQVLVNVGDRVKAGQPLLITDDREADAARGAAALELRAADARLEDVRRRLAVVDRAPAEEMARAAARLTTAERDVTQVPTRQWRDSPERAQAAYDQARARAERMQKLFDQGLVARQELDDAQIAVRVAQDDLNNARRAAAAGSSLLSAQTEQTQAQLQLARASREQQRIVLQGELQSAQVQRDQAEYRLEAATDRIRAATVTASTDGVVVELPARPGDQVYAGAPLARVAVLDVMVAEVQVAPSLINALRPGAPARVRLPGMPPTDATGTIATVNPIPGRNGNHVVSVKFDNQAGRLLAGQVAEVRFALQ
jgi:multidrug efflux pump subunit AcrA (membrane-fusion protein)